MHSCLMRGEKTAAIQKRLASKYQVDITTVRNVYQRSPASPVFSRRGTGDRTAMLKALVLQQRDENHNL